MKILRNIFTNPFAIATALVHWLVFIYCLIFEATGVFSKTISMHRSDEVYQWLISLNYLPLSMVETIGTTLEKTIGMNLILNIILMGFALFIVNCQWMFIGFCFSELFKAKEKSLN
ncbi:MAG: hypothetical protein H0U50_02615 [Pyrinomonadaceae bacterium]|nr:hypothetical protein [Pyrinomonadaceae bacterium]